jgi:DNA repair exonuclease SbcCD nuclease subunit
MRNLRILFIGDPHLKINNFEQSINFLRWVEQVVQEKSPDLVVNLGDTFHNHAVLRSEILKEFKDHVLSITSTTPYWYVVGNHDQWKPKDNKYHALQVLDGIKDFTVFDKTVHFGPENALYEGITVVPYVQEFDDFPTDTGRLCITHNTFIGADYGFKREDCGIDSGKVNADFIISGHIHKRQSFGNVIYPGTPYAHNANDVDHTKGLLLFESASYRQEFIESPFPRWRSIEFEIEQNRPITSLHSLLLTELNSSDKWILRVTGPKAELSAYFKSKDYFELTKGKDVIIKANPTDAEKQNRVQIKASSEASIIEEYVNKVYSGGLDKPLIIQKAQEIVKNIQ